MSTPQQIRDFFVNNVQPVFSDLISKIVINRPEDIQEFALKYFQKERRTYKLDDSDQQPDRFDQIKIQYFKEHLSNLRQAKGRFTRRRVGVSAEANTYFSSQRNKPISLKIQANKDEVTQIKLKFYFSNSFLFKDFTQTEITFLINSMSMRTTAANEVIIQEGEYGQCMYFVDQGLYECSVIDKQIENGKKWLRIYQQGDAFGELCILHSAKRLATVVSKTVGVLFCLSRQYYKHIKKVSIVKRRSLYLQSLKNVSIFSNLSKQDLQKLCDLLQQKSYESNEYVLHEGDLGSKFFIVLQGLLVAKREQDDTLYQCYQEGDYFGELALINNKPRQMSVVTITKCKLVWLSRTVFLNVINIEKTNIEVNQKYKNGKPRTPARRKKFTTLQYPEQ